MCVENKNVHLFNICYGSDQRRKITGEKQQPNVLDKNLKVQAGR